jgi:hypothetical protein
VFAELPKFFDRDFVVGYFLPVAVFLVSAIGIATGFNLWPSLIPTLQTNLLVQTTVIVLVTWLLATTLVVSNRSILQLLEGYGDYNPLKLIRRQYRRYDELTAQLARLVREYEDCRHNGRPFPQDSQADLSNKQREFAEHFPGEREWVLPTAFGNTIRAFESYSYVMYGVDPIMAWNRLLAVIPKDFRDLIDSAKAQMDFWVNLWVLSFLCIVEFVALAIWTRSSAAVHLIWIPLVAVLVILLAQERARGAAFAWGDLVKSSFDVYLPKLREQFALPADSDRETEHQLWRALNRAILYRDPAALPERSEPEPPDDGDAQAE